MNSTLTMVSAVGARLVNSWKKRVERVLGLDRKRGGIVRYRSSALTLIETQNLAALECLPPQGVVLRYNQ